MNWLNLRLVTMRAPEYIGAEPVSRATWLNVLAYCCEQENGGRIVGARNWKDRQWQQTCGVMLSEVDGAKELLEWDGDDLKVWSYPSEKEAEIQSKREAGSRGGNSKAKRAREARPEESAKHSHKHIPSSATSSANSSASTEGEEEVERKEKENSKKKGNEEEVKSFCASLDLPLSDGVWFYCKCEGNGWTNDKKPIKDWRATIRAWKAAGYMPSQKNAPKPQPELPDLTTHWPPDQTEEVFNILRRKVGAPEYRP